MTQRVNENRDTTALVERYIGTAYDTVKLVADNLDLITQVAEDLTEFKNVWQGNQEFPPTERPDGTPLMEGDRYYNTTTKNVYIYSNGQWTTQNAATTTTEVILVEAGDIQNGDTVITLSGSYVPGSGDLAVHVGGVYQYSQSIDPTGAYQETNSQTITFPGTELAIDEAVTVDIVTSVDVISPVIGVQTGLYNVQGSGQTVIPVPNDMEYTPGRSNLQVHQNGLLLFAGDDYVESSPTTITLTSPANMGDKLVFTKGELVTNDPDPELTFYQIETLASFYENREFLDASFTVIVKHGYATGDGLGATYFYDATADRTKANGVTLVDPSVIFNQQGEGVGLGCWARTYGGEIYPAWFNTTLRGIGALSKMAGLPNDIVRIVNFFELSNTGGGTFVYIDNVDWSLHDGGTIISPAVIAAPGTPDWYVAPAPGTGLGCWVRVNDVPTMNVEAYGGQRVPGYDNFNAFDKAAQGALNLQRAIEVPKGSYECSANVTGEFFSFGVVNISGGGVITTIKNLLL